MPHDGLVRHGLSIPDDWLDAHEMLAVPFYTAAFDLGIDALKQVLGIDEACRVATRRSTVALEAHLVVLGPVPRGAEVEVTTRIVDHDAKRIHVAQELRHAGRLTATRESMTISFDLDARRSCAFAAGILARIDALHDAQRALPAYCGRADRLGVDAGTAA